MAIEQMKYIRIMGPIGKFDELVLKHIINGNIELEPAYKQPNVPGVIPFEGDHSLENILKRMQVLYEEFQIKLEKYDLETIENELLEPIDTKVLERHPC